MDLEIPERIRKLGDQAQAQFVWQRWPEGNVLIIIDDVPNYDAIASYLPPPDPRFKVLITTRLNLGATVKAIEIEELSDESAIALLKSIVGDERIETQIVDAEKLCEWVGNLPLGLELLGRFLARKPDWAIARLLKRLESKRLAARALVEGESGMTASLGVAAALELSWAELDDDEQALACLLGMFAVAPIPWKLVEQCYENDPNDVEDWRDGLRDHSLVRRVREREYQLHQIVQEFVREKLKKQGEDAIVLKQAFGRMMVDIALNIDETPKGRQIEKVRGAVVHLEETAVVWLDFLSEAEKISLFVGIGRFYAGQGNYRFAERWYQRCLESLKKQFGANHLYIAISYNNLATLYIQQGHYEKVEKLYLQALEIFQKELGDENLGIDGILNNLAGLYLNQWRYEEAEQLYHQSLEISQKLLGNEHPDVATRLNNLAGLYLNQGRYEEAEQQSLQALELRKSVLGNDHIDTLFSLNNLAEIYQKLGRYEEAESVFQKVYEQMIKTVGVFHPNVATVLNNLANLYVRQERFEEAERLALQALSLSKRKLDADHPDIAFTYFTLGIIYHQQSQYRKAKSLYILALQIFTQRLGNSHATTQGLLLWIYELPIGLEPLPLEDLGL